MKNTTSDKEILAKVVHDVKFKKGENNEAQLPDAPNKKSKKDEPLRRSRRERR